MLILYSVIFLNKYYSFKYELCVAYIHLLIPPFDPNTNVRHCEGFKAEMFCPRGNFIAKKEIICIAATSS